MIRD
jgi:hypothetical protein